MENCVDIKNCSWWICRKLNICDLWLHSLPRPERIKILTGKDYVPIKRIERLYKKAALINGTRNKNRFVKDGPLYTQYVVQGEKCFYCKESTPYSRITRDHYRPRTKGGKNLNNMVLACGFCNGLKSNLTIEQFREQAIYSKNRLSKTNLSIPKLEQIISTCGKILNNEIEIPFVKYGT